MAFERACSRYTWHAYEIVSKQRPCLYCASSTRRNSGRQSGRLSLFSGAREDCRNLLRIERLDDVVVETGFARAALVGVLSPACHGYQQHRSIVLAGAQLPCEVIPAHTREP